MTQLVALQPQQHRQLKVDTNRVESIGAQERMIPVVLSEFVKLSVQYPIVFTRNGDDGPFVPVILLGFEDNENLFWRNGIWDAIYVPLNVTRQPFFIGKDGQSQRNIICIDIASPCISMEEGEAIYDSDGNETEFMQSIRERLSILLNGEQEMQAFIDVVKKLNLIAPLPLDINFADGSKHRIDGIYSINEEALQALDNDTIGELHESRYLRPIYTMINSLSHIYGLIQRKNNKLA